MSKVVYPYIPNSVPEVKKQMLKELGLKSVEEIYAEIPEHLRFKGTMNCLSLCCRSMNCGGMWKES